ncbi:MAG TPA: efflux transporter outer membrane subunit [Anaerolineae bacterium]|nr:efflux transporter outer membrane subunit [Anaerolineae bacterium]HZX16074.1 efflux transporter outer membrane subunit [Pseudomonas sp.]
MIDLLNMQRWSGLIAALLLAGCAVGPTYERPAVESPSDWVADKADARWPAIDWWTAFRDPVLDRLVIEALANNHDLKAAVQRIAQARALAQVAGAAHYPSLSASAQASRQNNSNNNLNGKFVTPNSYQAGLTASYVLDLFGLNRDQAEAAAAKLKGSEFERQTVELGVAAVTASSYFKFAALDARLAVAKETLAKARHAAELVRTRQQAGMATALQVAQQQAEVASLQAAIPTLQTQRRQVLNALAMLAGHLPDGFDVKPTAIAQLGLPQAPAGLPSALLERRPDILRAEAALAGANADIRAATAALFPRINLTAQGGYASAALRQLFDPGNTFYSLAAGLTAPLFEGGKLRGELAYTEARYGELVQNYRQTVLAAFTDVENALTAQRNTDDTLVAQRDAVTQATLAYSLAEFQYEQGMVDYLAVLTAQRSLLAADDAEAQARFARLDAAVSVYQALGGGWNIPQ